MTAFPHLFTPLTIRHLTIPNRIFSSGHLTHFAENNLPSKRHRDYYEARARGGIGMITMEVQSVSRHCWPVPSLCFADTDAIIEALLRLSQLTLDYPEILEMDINPLAALEPGRGVVAIDSRITIAEQEGGSAAHGG